MRVDAVGVGAAEEPIHETADSRTRNAQQDRRRQADPSGARHDQPRERADEESDDQDRQDHVEDAHCYSLSDWCDDPDRHTAAGASGSPVLKPLQIFRSSRM